ncbi:MAG: hypothetical protein QOG77_3150 [Solirubrobacteraceae bacterium]|nr:hypothetical protein [Solirubrobacteraceae bacterium]
MARDASQDISGRDTLSTVPERFARLGEHDLRAVFDGLSESLAVVDRTGAVIATNAAFRRFVGLTPGPDGPEPTCCALLGCRLPRNAALGGCVTDRLLASGDRVEDLRLELPGRAGVAWLSGAPLDETRELAFLELRAAPRVAPRERPSPPKLAPIRVRALGRMQVETPAAVIRGGWLDQRPGQLLKYLVAERRRVVPIEDIAEALWPEAEFTTVNTVRHLVHILRERLDPGRQSRSSGAGSHIASVRGGYTIDGDAVTVDSDEFAEAAERGLSAFTAGDQAAEAALQSALSLYRGDFLVDDVYATWAHTERERMRGLVERMLVALGDLAQARDDIRAATAYLERLAELEPFDSDPQRQLIVLALREGRRGRALRQYEAFDLRMQRAFGERPDFTIDELMRYARPTTLP